MLRQLVGALLVAGVAEVVLLRLTTRVGVHLPKNEIAMQALDAASFTGAFALNVASILATALLALIVGAVAWRAQSVFVRWALFALVGVTFWGLAASMAAGSAIADLAFGLGLTLLLVALVLLAVTRSISMRGSIALGVIVAAYVAHQYYALGYLTYQALGSAAPLPAGIQALRLGELLVVAGAAAVFWAWGADRWRHAGRIGGVFALAPVVVLLVGSFAPAATTSILALWTTGLSLYLPLPLYLAALGLYLLTIAACWRSDAGYWTGAGLLLILLAGYMPEATYYHLAFALGVALLAGHAGALTDASEQEARASGG